MKKRFEDDTKERHVLCVHVLNIPSMRAQLQGREQ